MRETIKFGTLLNLVDNIMELHKHTIKKGDIPESPRAVFKFRLCITSDESTWITVNTDNPLLVAFRELDVYSASPDEDFVTEVWFTRESVIDMLKKACEGKGAEK